MTDPQGAGQAPGREERTLRDLRPWWKLSLGRHIETMDDRSVAGSTAISEVAEEQIVRVTPRATLRAVAEALTAADVGAVVVGDVTNVTGIISERDIVHAVAGHRDLEITHAADIANTNLVWCDFTATVAEVAAEMMEHYVRHVLVERFGRLVGIVSARDLLGLYAAADVNVAEE